ncbi:MAG: methyltransferase domain-containing protein [Chloroflexota bacterium]|nr:methyltransferase domain-containing protein [Chloroflexota bacterium]
MTAERPDGETGIEALLPLWEDADVIAAFAAWHPGAEVFYRPVSEALLAEAGVRPGTRLLDVGTGTGIPALLAAEAVDPGGAVVATDPSAGLLVAAEANARAAGLGNVSFRRAAAEALPFPDGSFDAAVSQFGLMFVADLLRALGEIRRVLRPGGSAAFLAWGPYERNPFTAAFQDVARRYRAEPPRPGWSGSAAPAQETPPDPRHPFRFAEPGSLAAALRAAGFADVGEETREVRLGPPDLEPISRFWFDANRTLEEALPEERRRVPGRGAGRLPALRDGRRGGSTSRCGLRVRGCAVAPTAAGPSSRNTPLRAARQYVRTITFGFVSETSQPVEKGRPRVRFAGRMTEPSEVIGARSRSPAAP